MSDNLVTIRTFQYLPEAEAARMHLEAAGYTVFLTDAETVNMGWSLDNAVGGIKLQVPQASAERALAALERKAADRQAPGQKGKKHKKGRKRAGGERCLACGESFPRNRPRCPACGWSYLANTEPGAPEVQTEPARREANFAAYPENAHPGQRAVTVWAVHARLRECRPGW